MVYYIKESIPLNTNLNALYKTKTFIIMSVHNLFSKATKYVYLRIFSLNFMNQEKTIIEDMRSILK